VSWHHFLEDGPLSGLNTFDLGLAARWGNHIAFGAVLRDLATRAVAGTPVQRRYQLEAELRPFGDDRLAVALGGQIGETRGDVDAWGRFSLRAARGVYLVGELRSDALHVIEESPSGVNDVDARDLRVSLGLDVSFGKLGVIGVGTGLRDDTGADHALGGAVVLRVSAVGPPSVIQPAAHLERVELSGEIGPRELTAIVTRLAAIERDPSAKGVVVLFDAPTAGWAKREELRDALLGLRRAGKKVFAYLTDGTSGDYYIASAADKIYLDPSGGLALVGMASTALYFRGALDAIGIEPEFVKIGEYKSAPEELTRTGPSPAAAQMRADLAGSLWQRWVAAIADGRHLTPEQVEDLVDHGPYTAGQLAADHRLVDAVADPDKIGKLIAAEVGGALPVDAPAVTRPPRWHYPGIAVIYIDGDIVDGASRKLPVIGKLVGGQSIIEAIDAARADPRIGAIVLRIDSPGGSAGASELISREVFETRGVKPILCSMSDVAASGGYFLAAGCDTIIAEPMTITGSIGIFSGKPDLSGLLAKLGVTTSTLAHGKHATIGSMYAPYTDDERAAVMQQLRYMYGRFVGAVAEGRKLTKEQVDAIGRGHVYTGEQAMPIHLVDRFGGLEDALALAKQRMGLPADARVTLYELPRVEPGLLGTIGKLIGVGAHDDASLLLSLPIVQALARGLPASLLVAPQSLQARLPFDLAE
jgi:protease-4